MRFGMPPFLAGCLIALLCWPVPGRACIIVYAGFEAQTNFRVQAVSKGGPLTNLRALLTRDGHAAITAPFDAKGVAFFRRVTPAKYSLQFDDGTGPELQGTVEIKARDRQARALLELPYTPPNLRVASLKGRLHLPDQVNGQPQPPIALQLRQTRIGPSLVSTFTDDQGAFNLTGVRPGLYVLELAASSDRAIRAQLKVRVDPNAPLRSLDLDLAPTSCGLIAIERAACPAAAFQIQSRAGQVTDESGGSLPKTQVQWFDLQGRLLASQESDDYGNFPAPPAEDSLDLVLHRSAFTRFRARVTVTPSSTQASRPWQVRLGLLGACGHAIP